MDSVFYLYQDDSLRAQHNAVRTTAGWYDFTHKLLELTGEDATTFLGKMYPANLDKLGVGKAKYTIMLDEDGLICDDVIIFRLEEKKYWISTLYAKDLLKRFARYDADYNVVYEDITGQWRMYSVQGLEALEIVNGVIDNSADDLKRYQIRDAALGDIPIKVSRTGFTGETLGYELYVPAEYHEVVEARLAEEGDKAGALHVTEIDVMAMTLAAEVGYYLMLDIRRCTPYEVGFEHAIDWTKDFVGKKALKRVKDKEPARRLVGIEVPDYDAVIYGGPHGGDVKKGDKVIGRVTKFTYGYTVEKNIGYALIDNGSAETGDTVTCNGYDVIITEKNHLGQRERRI
ncbi:MAG: aminomethyltransferase family protein [Spirochaetia bacterium]|nr:aminomethyltransferase family protein [Spirochaetia bacterium]